MIYSGLRQSSQPLHVTEARWSLNLNSEPMNVAIHFTGPVSPLINDVWPQ